MIVFTACSIHFIWSNSCRGFRNSTQSVLTFAFVRTPRTVFSTSLFYSPLEKLGWIFNIHFFLCKNQRNVTNKNIKPQIISVPLGGLFFSTCTRSPSVGRHVSPRVRLFPEYMFGQNWCSRISIISHLYNTLWWVKSTAVNKWTDAVSRTDTSKTMRFIKYIYETLIRALACSCSQLHRFHSLRET